MPRKWTDVYRRNLNKLQGRYTAIEQGLSEDISALLEKADTTVAKAINYAAIDEETYLRRLTGMRTSIRGAMDRFGSGTLKVIERGQVDASEEGANTAGEAARQTADTFGYSIAWDPDTPSISEDVLNWLARFPYGGVPLSEKVFQISNTTMNSIFGRVSQGVILGQPAATIARDVRRNLLDPEGHAREAGVIKGLRTRARKARAAGEKEKADRLFASARQRQAALPAVAPGVYRSAHKNSMRVARTEVIRAYQESAVLYGQRKRWVGGFYWFPNANACPICVDLRGYYSLNSVPIMPHPHCGCRVEQVARRAVEDEGIELQNAPASVSGVARRTYFTSKAVKAAA